MLIWKMTGSSKTLGYSLGLPLELAREKRWNRGYTCIALTITTRYNFKIYYIIGLFCTTRATCTVVSGSTTHQTAPRIKNFCWLVSVLYSWILQSRFTSWASKLKLILTAVFKIITLGFYSAMPELCGYSLRIM